MFSLDIILVHGLQVTWQSMDTKLYNISASLKASPLIPSPKVLNPAQPLFDLCFQASVTAALFVGYSLSCVSGIVVNAVSVTLSGFVLLHYIFVTLLSLILPAMLVSVPHLVPLVTFMQGFLYNAAYQMIIHIMARWIPDKESTFMSSLYISGFITGRTGIMLLSAPIAEKVHWSAPFIIFGSVSLCIIGLLGTQVN